MSQQAETGFDRAALSRHAKAMVQKNQEFGQEVQGKEVELLYSQVEQLAKFGPQHADKISEVRLLLKDLLEVGREGKAHDTSLRHVANQIESSEPTLETQDYRELLQTKRDYILDNQQYDWETSKEVARFDEAAKKGTGGSDSDEEVMMQAKADDIAPNRNCPCSLKPVLELTDPVEDDHGIVYDRAAVESHIRQMMRTTRQNEVSCPQAGSTHKVSLGCLRTATKVSRAQKRHKRREAERAEAGSDDDGVLDID